jgi:hypothetical protein
VVIKGVVITMSIQIAAADRVPSFILIFGLVYDYDSLMSGPQGFSHGLL